MIGLVLRWVGFCGVEPLRGVRLPNRAEHRALGWRRPQLRLRRIRPWWLHHHLALLDATHLLQGPRL